MSKRLIFTIALLLIINLMPVTYYLIRQSASISDNEKMVQMVFEKQVQSILFSLNQETENTLNQWINNLDIPIDYSGTVPEVITGKLFTNNPSLKQIKIESFNNKDFNQIYSRDDSLYKTSDLPISELKPLKSFIGEGYQKIIPRRQGNDVTFTFFLKSGNNDLYCTILTSLQLVIEQNIRPIIQKTAQDIFVITVNDSIENKNIFSTDPVIGTEFKNRSSSWYLPGIWYSIQLKTQTIEDLISKRNKTENILLIALLILSLTGTLIIILTIRKTIMINNMKSEFIANVSHELRTPLALISMYSETLLLGRINSEEKKHQYMQVINQETSRLSDLVNRILNFSKIEKKKRTYSITDVVLNDLIEQVVSNWEPHFRANNVTCSFSPQCENIVVRADREALIETLVNLIDNAIKYGKENDKRIELKCYKSKEQLILEVIDNGIGISKRNQRKIFDKFYRVTLGDLAHKAKGAGLGLNIVLNNMKAFNGKVKVSSEPGKGSCFSLIFPVKKDN